MNELKLFVVGEPSGRPSDWPIMCDRAFVIARDADEARKIARRDTDSPVAEVLFDEPTVLCVEKDDGIEE
jgi:hypothetical protein